MHPFRRSLQRFRDDPSSIRRASVAVVTLTIVTVFAGAAVMWIFDRDEYPTYGRALWFTLQTVTTVGYGDVTPQTPLGQIVAGVVMLVAIGLITVVTGAITSAFVEAARRRMLGQERAEEVQMLAQLNDTLVSISDRLDQLELAVRSDQQARPTQSPDRDATD